MKHTMFEPSEPLSSDLEWMLQSGQVERELLLEALLAEFYTPTARWLAAWLGDEQQVRPTLEQVFAQAVLEAHRYRSAQPVEVWFFRIAVKAGRGGPRPEQALPGAREAAPNAPLLRALAALDERARLPLLLHSLFDWPPAQIAAVLERSAAQVEPAMQLGLQSLAEIAGQPTGAVAAGLAQSARLAWPETALSEGEMSTLAAVILARTDRQAGRLRRFAGVKELALLGLALVMVVAAIWGAETFFPEAAAETTHIVRRVTATPAPTDRSTPGSLSRARRATAAAGTQNAQPPGGYLPSPTPIPEDAFYTVQPGEAWGQIAGLLKVSAAELLDLNRIPPGMSPRAGQALLIPGRIPTAALPTPPPVTPVPTQMVSETLPNAEAVMDMVERAVLQSIWVDARLITFGPPGYIGPPQVLRMQMWVREGQALILSGLPNGKPETVFLVVNNQAYLARPEISPWFSQIHEPLETTEPFMQQLQQVFDALSLNSTEFQARQMNVVGRETMFGAPVVVVEQVAVPGRSARRMWIDEQRGLELRSLTYYEGLDSLLNYAVALTGVAHDQPFPEQLFHPELPWRGGFAAAVNGSPEAWLADGAVRDDGVPLELLRPLLPIQQAPPDFDPATGELTFQVAGGLDAFFAANLFSGPYFLGSVPFDDPFEMVCDRSPDGRQFAFIARQFSQDRQSGVLRWFRLDQPNQMLTSGPLDSLTQAAFSPDGSLLAVFNNSPQPADRGLYLVDSITGANRRLYSIDDARSLVWHPDGSALAFIGRTTTPSLDERVMVVDAVTGELSYSRSIDFESVNQTDWPTVEWGVDFPVETQGIAECRVVP